MSTLFPKWTNAIPQVLGAGLVFGLIAVTAGAWYWMTPAYLEVGYQPTQPIAFSHQTHAGLLGMDCRYCHTNVEDSRHANIPTTTTCMNCHTVADNLGGYLAKAVSIDGSSSSAHWDSPDLQLLRQLHAEGKPVPWRRVHKLPDYVAFPHAAHVNAGVSCYSCHKRIDQMPIVYQAESLGMGWCLECHRAPENHLVDTNDVSVTNLRDVQALLNDSSYSATMGEQLKSHLQRNPPQTCGACHY